MRILIVKNGQAVVETTNLAEVQTSLDDEEAFIWVDLYHDAPEESRQVMLDVFNFHPLSVDDALVEIHVPKIDDWGNYLYLSLVAIRSGQPLDDISKSVELDVFLGPNYLVTYHQESYPAVDVVWGRILNNEYLLQHSSRFVLYLIMDELAIEYMKMIDFLDNRVVDIEGTIIQKPDKKFLKEVFSIKRSLLNLRRIVVPQGVILNKLSLGDFKIVEPDERMYFRDVYDHLVRVHEVIESQREFVSGVLDIYLSVVNNQLNNTIKTLTIITTLFMLLSFVNEFFEIKFFTSGHKFTPWTGGAGFGLIIAGMFLIPLIIYLWARRQN
jgi:magnesium transporter